MENYEVQECLYKVPDREILLVKDKKTGESRVIKKVTVSQMKDEEKKETDNEVEALKKLHHRHIVSYVTSFSEGRTINIVMAYCRGGDLYDWIDKHRKDETSFETADIVMILRQLCEALAYIHGRHILHRDIKPRNIFVENRWTVQLGDFGIAKILESTSQDAETHYKGTHPYSAPEIFSKESYRHKCDIWSLRCVLYEMITLEQPFKATGSLQELIAKIQKEPYPPVPKHLDKNLSDLIAELLDKDPGERPNAKQILAGAFLNQPSCQAISRADFLLLMSKVDQMSKSMEAMEARLASEVNKTKSEMFAFIEKESQLIINSTDRVPAPRKWSFDFYVENFKGLEKSGNEVYSLPVYVHAIRTSVMGFVEFNDNGEMIVWLKFARHPRKVGFDPVSGHRLMIKATVKDIHKKTLTDFPIGVLNDIEWDEQMINSNVDFGFPIGTVKCKDLLDKRYGEAEEYAHGAILIRFEIVYLGPIKH